MKISCEMEVDVLHRNDLRIAAAGRAAFDAETRTQAWLTQTNDRLFADAIERVPQANSGRGFSLAGRGWRYRRHQNELCIRPRLQLIHIVQRDLGLEVAVKKKITEIDAKPAMPNLGNRHHVGLLGNLDIRFGILMLVVHFSHAPSKKMHQRITRRWDWL